MPDVKVFWENEQELDLSDKNKVEKVRTIYGERKGRPFIDIRILKKYDGNEEFRYTSNGAAIPYDTAVAIAKKIVEFDENKRKENKLE